MHSDDKDVWNSGSDMVFLQQLCFLTVGLYMSHDADLQILSKFLMLGFVKVDKTTKAV